MWRLLVCVRQGFLQHLAATNGAASIPPGAISILNSRACRSALMFGTALQRQQASAVLSALKETRCEVWRAGAHGIGGVYG